MSFINFKTKNREDYDSISSKNPDTLYFIKDEGKIIKNNVEYGGKSSEGIPGLEVIVTAPAGSTIHYSNSTTSANVVLGAEETEKIINLSDYGTWNFYATKDNQTSNTVSLEVNVVQRYNVSLSFSVTYGVKIQINASDPATAVTYIEDAIGITPGWDNWKDKPIFKDIRPCILRDGEVVKYLQRDDYTKYEDGTTSESDVIKLGYDVMVEIPKIGYKIESDETYHYIYITDEPNKEGFCCLAHSREIEGDCDKIYIGSYLGYSEGSKLYSNTKNPFPTMNISLTNSRSYAQARGDGYELFSFYPLTLLQCLFLIIYKNRDGQSALGKGFTDASNNGNIGSTTKSTFCYGDPNSGTTHVKFLGIEDFWGNLYQWIDGIRTNSSRQIHTWYKDFNGVDNDSGNHQHTAEGPSSNQSGYMKNIVGTNHGGFCEKEANGSSTTYWADGSALNAGYCAYFGGDWDYGSSAGPFYLNVGDSASNSHSTFGARIIYKHLAD